MGGLLLKKRCMPGDKGLSRMSEAHNVQKEPAEEELVCSALCAAGNAFQTTVVHWRHSRDCHPAGDGIQDQDGARHAHWESSLPSDMHQCQHPEGALGCSCS